MTFDVIIDKHRQMRRMEWLRFAIAGGMVGVIVADTVMTWVLKWPAVPVLIAVLASQGVLATCLFWMNHKVAVARREFIASTYGRARELRP